VSLSCCHPLTHGLESVENCSPFAKNRFMPRDCYQVLGLQSDATAEEVKRAYRELARRYHPDRNPGDAHAETRFKEVQEAYDILGDQNKRYRYDWFSGPNAKSGAGGEAGSRGHGEPPIRAAIRKRFAAAALAVGAVILFLAWRGPSDNPAKPDVERKAEQPGQAKGKKGEADRQAEQRIPPEEKPRTPEATRPSKTRDRLMANAPEKTTEPKRAPDETDALTPNKAVFGDKVAGNKDTKAEKAIKALGGFSVRDNSLEGRPMIRVNLNATQVTDAGLNELAGLKYLLELDLSVTKVTDAGLTNLIGLPTLRNLNLYTTNVTDAGLRYLARIPSLRDLDVGNTKVTDAGVAEFSKALPKCRVTR
jgi:curved DNA-binding protein CbpA